ncbi:MAG: MerR family transcriptional regulator [Candidatus Limnocylindria bacterium]
MARRTRPVYVISIAASLAGCHPRTLRIYEEEGLVDPVRTQTNIRLYSDDDLHRVRCIRYLTQVRGVNLAGVKLLFQLRGADELMEEIAAALGEELTEEWVAAQRRPHGRPGETYPPAAQLSPSRPTHRAGRIVT